MESIMFICGFAITIAIIVATDRYFDNYDKKHKKGAIWYMFMLTKIATEKAIEMFLTGATAAITLLCTGTKVRRSYGKNRKTKWFWFTWY